MTASLEFQDLTPELHLRILSFLDIPSLLRMAPTSSEYEALVLQCDVWVKRYNTTWPSEAKSEVFSLENRIYCRQELFRRARIRFDGAYVSRCAYNRRIQEGSSLTDNRTYLQIVYHRIFRFLPNNTALMLLSEKGTKGSARAAYLDFIKSDQDPDVLLKYGKQLNRCTWKLLTVDDTGATISLCYYDGKICWSAKLLVCHGTRTRQAGSRLVWQEYKFWDPVEVADQSRRQLHREREAVASRLRFVHLGGRIEVVTELLATMESLSEAIALVRESRIGDDVDMIPEELTREIKLWPDHFPVVRFGHSKILSHLF